MRLDVRAASGVKTVVVRAQTQFLFTKAAMSFNKSMSSQLYKQQEDVIFS